LPKLHVRTWAGAEPVMEQSALAGLIDQLTPAPAGSGSLSVTAVVSVADPFGFGFLSVFGGSGNPSNTAEPLYESSASKLSSASAIAVTTTFSPTSSRSPARASECRCGIQIPRRGIQPPRRTPRRLRPSDYPTSPNSTANECAPTARIIPADHRRADNKDHPPPPRARHWRQSDGGSGRTCGQARRLFLTHADRGLSYADPDIGEQVLRRRNDIEGSVADRPSAARGDRIRR